LAEDVSMNAKPEVSEYRMDHNTTSSQTHPNASAYLAHTTFNEQTEVDQDRMDEEMKIEVDDNLEPTLTNVLPPVSEIPTFQLTFPSSILPTTTTNNTQ